jgi:hypothetical protein
MPHLSRPDLPGAELRLQRIAMVWKYLGITPAWVSELLIAVSFRLRRLQRCTGECLLSGRLCCKTLRCAAKEQLSNPAERWRMPQILLK